MKKQERQELWTRIKSLCDQGKYQQFLDEYNKFKSDLFDQNTAQTYGLVLEGVGMYSEALAHYNQRGHSLYANGVIDRARCLVSLKQYDSARLLLDSDSVKPDWKYRDDVKVRLRYELLSVIHLQDKDYEMQKSMCTELLPVIANSDQFKQIVHIQKWIEKRDKDQKLKEEQKVKDDESEKRKHLRNQDDERDKGDRVNKKSKVEDTTLDAIFKELQSRPNFICVVCKDMIRTIRFDPCSHMCCCKTCSDNITECPMCRSPIKLKQSTFLS